MPASTVPSKCSLHLPFTSKEEMSPDHIAANFREMERYIANLLDPHSDCIQHPNVSPDYQWGFEEILYATDRTPEYVEDDIRLTKIKSQIGTQSSSDITIVIKKNGSTVHTFTHTASTTRVTENIDEEFDDGDVLTIEMTNAGNGGENLDFKIEWGPRT